MTKALPTFIIIGAGKSGTTALHQFCESHPEVWMANAKETNFFELEGKPLTVDPKDDPEMRFHFEYSINNWSDYHKEFEGGLDLPARGESSPMYLYGERAPKHIKEHIPNIKLVAILRDPVQRLYSRWTHLLRDQVDPVSQLEFSTCLEPNSIWNRRNDLIQEGFYHTHLSRYTELYGPDQLKVFLFDDLRAHPDQVMRELFEHIGVDAHYKPDLEREFNVSGKPKNPVIDALIGTNSFIIQGAKKLAPSLISKLRKSAAAQAILLNVRKKNMEKPDVNTEVFHKLYHTYYKKEVEALEKLIGRDLSSWKKY